MSMGMQWRLLRSGHLPGAMNMAIDEAILLAVAEGERPTLRFYGWEPPAMSIGYFQDVDRQVDPAACKSLGVDVVRRPTGGRAVLHDVEVTYSLILPEKNPIIPQGITESYRAISAGMVRGLAQLGLDAKMVSLKGRRSDGHSTAIRPESSVRSQRYEVTVEAPERKPTSAACFDAPSWYEVTVEGKKVVGSAQMRRAGMLLQHGSIPLELQVDKLFTCLRFSSIEARARAKESFRKKATSIRTALGRAVSFMETCEAVIAGLEETLGVETCEGELSARERKNAERLARKKYSRLEWKNSGKSKDTQTA